MKSVYLFILSFLYCYTVFGQATTSTNGKKFVLLEYATGAGVQFGPDGDLVAEQIRNNNSNAIVASLHIDYFSFPDAMKLPDNQQYAAAYLNGYPQGTANRAQTSVSFPATAGIGRADWNTAVNEEAAIPSTYDITLTHGYDTASKVVKVTMTGTARVNLTGEYRFNIYVVEDSVTGTGTGYDQKNVYNTTSGHPYYGAGNPILGYNHMQVVRATLGGIWGDSVVTNPSANSKITKTYFYTLPAGHNPYNTRLIGIVSKYGSNISDREIQNAIEVNLAECKQPQDLQICGVTCDSASGKNVIAWDTTGTSGTISYRIYKESATPGVYQLLDSVDANALPKYIDNVSNPFAGSYKYKITAVNYCRRETPIDSSEGHKTIYLTIDQSQGFIKLNWTAYEGISYSSVNILRSVGGAPFQNIGQVAATATSFTDMNPTSGVLTYKIQIPNPGNCLSGNILSNTENATVGVNELSIAGKGLLLFPNPVRNVFSIKGIADGDGVLLTDITGKIIRQWPFVDTKQVYDIQGLNDGIYFIKVFNNDGLQKANLKLIKN